MHKSFLSPQPYQTLSCFVYFIIFIPIDINWFLIVVLICIFLMNLDVEHLFMYSIGEVSWASFPPPPPSYSSRSSKSTELSFLCQTTVSHHKLGVFTASEGRNWLLVGTRAIGAWRKCQWQEGWADKIVYIKNESGQRTFGCHKRVWLEAERQSWFGTRSGGPIGMSGTLGKETLKYDF